MTTIGCRAVRPAWRERLDRGARRMRAADAAECSARGRRTDRGYEELRAACAAMAAARAEDAP